MSGADAPDRAVESPGLAPGSPGLVGSGESPASLPVAMHVGQLRQAVPGGIGRYVRQLLGALPGVGVAVHPFAAGPVPTPAGLDTHDPGRPQGGWPHDPGRPQGGWPHDPGRPQGGWAHDLGRPHDGVRYELWHRTGRPRLPRTLGAAVRVVHAPSLAVPPSTPGRPLVVTVHDLAFLHAPESFTRRGVAFHVRALALARRRAAMIVAPSHATRNDLVSHGFPGDRVVVAWHGAPDPDPTRDPTPVEPSGPDAARAIRKRLGLPERYVLAVGTVEPRKALDVTAAAVGALRGSGVDPDLELVIAGPPGWGDVDGLEHPWVRRLGAVDDVVLGALYGGAVVLAQSSRWEGFGFPVIEAMAYDCPVVVADTSSLPELVAGGAGIVVPAGDVDALAEAIASIVTDGSTRVRLVDAGRQRRRAFTWSASAAVHRAAYEAACEP